MACRFSLVKIVVGSTPGIIKWEMFKGPLALLLRVRALARAWLCARARACANVRLRWGRHRSPQAHAIGDHKTSNKLALPCAIATCS